MTIQELYSYGEATLMEAQIEDAKIDAWYLLEYVSDISRAMYYVKQNEVADEILVAKYEVVIQKRKQRIPLQHITGVQEFMGLVFEVNSHVLIPRQDTECLVECVREAMAPNMRMLDMCTGSGCIIISLLKYGIEKMKLVPQDSMGVDISEEALFVARKNAKNHGVDVPLVQSDLFTSVNGTYDIIVSNPPYIRTAVIESLQAEVKGHDPWLALDGKEDGLYFYRKIIKESHRHLVDNGQLYLEIGHDQGVEVAALMKAEGYGQITLKKDLAGLDRVVWGVYNKAKK